MYKLLLFILSGLLFLSAQSQVPDTMSIHDTTKYPDINRIVNDSISLRDSIGLTEKKTYKKTLDVLLNENRFLNSKGEPEILIEEKRKGANRDLLFYLLAFLILIFGLLKVFYSRYLSTLFRVFFNTSLRQSQLTDQLLQSKLPSLLFNIFFILAGGFYLYLLLGHLNYIDITSAYDVLLICIAALLIVYSIKYIVLKFTGWISGQQNVADTYIFIVFLFNKIIAIALIPVIIVMAFSDYSIVKGVVFASFIILGLLLLMRYLRSFNVLQNKVKVQRLHFFLYIIGLEILPLLLIYKTAVKLLTNNM